MHRPLPKNRYGVEIQVPTVHVECESLGDVLALLEGQAGVARVFDRHSQALVVDGAVKDVRESLGEMAADGQAAASSEARVGIAELASARLYPLEKGQEVLDARGYKVQISGALNIASAYYFGDLGGVVRRRDGDGQESFFRPMVTHLRTEG